MVRHVNVACLVVLVACGGGEGNPDELADASMNVTTDGAPQTSVDAADEGPLMAPEVRAVAASAAMSRLEELKSQGLPREQVAAQMVAFLEADPAFQSAGYSADLDNVWANFTDGVPFIIFDNHPPNPDVVPDPVFKLPQADTVPRDKQYRILRSLGDAYSANESATRVLLNERGYTAAARQSDQIEHLMTDVSGDGFFMWATHGGEYAWAADGKTLLYGLSTLTNATAENELLPPYKALLASGELGIGFAGVRYATPEELASADAKGKIDAYTAIDLKYKVLNRRVYFVNPKFVRTRFKFRENSVIIINACTSFTLALRSAFDDAGAAAYLGWERPTSRGGPISFIAIDRMLGGSSAAPIPDPDERPFDIGKVFEWMESKGLNSYQDATYGTVTFSHKLLGENYGLLAPSIKSIEIVEPPFKGMKARFKVSGIFGTKNEAMFPRELLVNGVPQAIDGGDRETIEGELDSTGAGSFGEAMVKIGGRESNVVPITAWNVIMKVVGSTNGSAKFTITLRLTMRADVHRFRDRPGGPADGVEPAVMSVPLLMESSTASWTMGGAFTSGGCNYTISGSGGLGLPDGGGSIQYLIALGVHDRHMSRITIAAMVMAGAWGNSQITCPPDPPVPALFPLAVPPVMTLNLDPDTYAIKPGEASFSASPFEIKATWEEILPFYPPTDMTASKR